MLNLLLAATGGFIGTGLRYLLNISIYDLLDYPLFPYGTFIINVVGCLLIGFLSGIAETREIMTPELRIFIFIGILGGFTTFSSFGYETFNLLRDQQFLFAAINIFGQVFIGLGSVWLGFSFSHLMR